MQKLVYYIQAYSPLRARTLARVGLAGEDGRHLLELLPADFQVGLKPRALPPELAELVYRLIFGQGLPEGCIYFLYKKKSQNPLPSLARDSKQNFLLKIS